MELNRKKCKDMEIDFRKNQTIMPQLKIEDILFDKVSSHKLLGPCIDDDFKWNTNPEYIIKKASKRLFLLKILKRYRTPANNMILQYGKQTNPEFYLLTTSVNAKYY